MNRKFSIIGAVTLASCLAFGPAGLIAILALFLNFSEASAVLGTYPDIATSSQDTYIAGNAYVQQVLWVDRALDFRMQGWQTTPFTDGMTGYVSNQSGKKPNNSQLMKAIIMINDTQKVHGDTVHLFSKVDIGGEGATGSQTRLGTGAQLKSGNMDVTIGLQVFSASWKQSVVDRNMIGKTPIQDQDLNDQIGKLHATRANETIIYRMMCAAGYGNAADGTAGTFAGTQTANWYYPDGVSGRSALRSNNTVDRALINMGGEILPGIGAQPMDTTNDSGGSVGNLYMFMSSHTGLSSLRDDTSLTQILTQGWDRGMNNPLFRGGFVNIDGHGVYRWTHLDHNRYGAIGSPLLPRAKLGKAISGFTGGTTTIQGGGLVNIDGDTVPQWFKHFSNAPVVLYGGISNIVASTSTTRYLMIINSDGTGWAVYSFTVNTGNLITLAARTTVTGATGNTTQSPTAGSTAHPIGSTIVECNAAGVCFGRSLMFGANAVVGGTGTINGSVAAPESGRLVKEVRDLENDIQIGVEGVAGYAAVKRPGDNLYPSFIVIEHAITVRGAPTILA